MPKGMTYAGTGVAYGGGLDQFKIAAAKAARETEVEATRDYFGFEPLPRSRGGSVYLTRYSYPYLQQSWSILGHLVETLGTKSLVADAMYKLTGNANYYRNLMQCAAAMVLNDAATGGVAPIVMNMLLEVGSSEWFKDTARSQAIIEGWRDACIKARCVWGGGETPVLKGLLYPDVFSISGSATGVSLHPDPEAFSDGSLIQDQDVIMFVMGSGIHANGLTMARNIAERKESWLYTLKNLLFGSLQYPLQALPNGYLIPLSDGRTYGEALLDPTPLYGPLVEDCLLAGVDLHYTVNITGHGLRKLMRPERPFAYMVDLLPKKLPIFEAIEEWGPVSEREAYETFNEGPGFALYVPPKEEDRVVAIADALGLKAYQAGRIYACEEKKVCLPTYPEAIEWAAEDLQIA